MHPETTETAARSGYEVRDPLTAHEAFGLIDSECERLSHHAERLEHLVKAAEERLAVILRPHHPSVAAEGPGEDVASMEFTTPLAEQIAGKAGSIEYRVDYLRRTIERLDHLLDRIEVP